MLHALTKDTIVLISTLSEPDPVRNRKIRTSIGGLEQSVARCP